MGWGGSSRGRFTSRKHCSILVQNKKITFLIMLYFKLQAQQFVVCNIHNPTTRIAKCDNIIRTFHSSYILQRKKQHLCPVTTITLSALLLPPQLIRAIIKRLLLMPYNFSFALLLLSTTAHQPYGSSLSIYPAVVMPDQF